MTKRNINRLLIPLLMIVSVLSFVILVYAAASGTHTPVTGVTVSVSGATDNSMSNGAVTVTAKGSAGVFGFGASAKTATITVTNVSGSAATISFNWTATSVNQLLIDGATYTGASGSFSKVMDADGSSTITITTAKNSTTNKLVMSNFAVVAAKDSSTVNFEFDSALGSVTVAGTAITSGYIQDISGKTGAALVATAKSGVSFLGWVDADGKILSTAASYTLIPATDMTVKAVYVNTTSDEAWFMVDSQYLTNDLNKAGELGNSIVLMNNGTLPAGNYTISAGKTLLIPYNASNTICKERPTLVNLNHKSNFVAPKAYRTLTMATGANISVNGAISVSGSVNLCMGYNGQPTGDLGFISMNTGSSITVNDSGFLYSWGYITGSGSVTASAGATIYECFQLRDFRGGSATTNMLNNKNRVFPFTQYYVQNIEVPMTLNNGATEYAFFAASVSSVEMPITIPFIGEGSMFKLESGSVVKDYEESTDRLIISVDGKLYMNSFSFTLKGDSGLGSLMSYEINSDKYNLPLTNNITVNINSGSEVNLNQDLCMLPGSVINIASNASLNVLNGNNLFVYDADEWLTAKYCYGAHFVRLLYAPGMGYTRTVADLKDAKIVVNGTLNASAGYIYTSLGSANICSSDTGKVLFSASQSATTTTHQATQADTSISYSAIDMYSAKLKNADGGYVNSADWVAGSFLTFHYGNGIWCCEHLNLTIVNNQSATCDICGATISCTYDNGILSITDALLDKIGDKQVQYYAIITDGNGNQKYFFDHVNKDEGSTVWTQAVTISKIEGAKISFVRDDFANDLIRLRGYQTDGGAIRFFATIQGSFDMWDSDGDGEYDIGFHEKYGGIRITMQVEGYDPLKHIQREVYSYLYNSDNGKSMEFIDSYVFSFRSNFTGLEGKILTISFAYVNRANTEEEFVDITDTFISSSYTITFVNGEVVLVPYTAAA